MGIILSRFQRSVAGPLARPLGLAPRPRRRQLSPPGKSKRTVSRALVTPGCEEEQCDADPKQQLENERGDEDGEGHPEDEFGGPPDLEDEPGPPGLSGWGQSRLPRPVPLGIVAHRAFSNR